MTDLLDFARGPMMSIAVAIFTIGVVARLLSLFLTPKGVLTSVPRDGRSLWLGGFKEIFNRMVPNPTFARAETFAFINGWVFHIGLAIVILGLGGHIMFFKHVFGISWPGLPNNFILLVGVITLFALVLALYARRKSAVLRLISNWDDYFTWLVTVLPLVTGLLSTMHLVLKYETMLALHVLSICLLLIWFPFGKLMHAFIVFASRHKTGVEMARKGVNL